jgi:hypothetical protein
MFRIQNFSNILLLYRFVMCGVLLFVDLPAWFMVVKTTRKEDAEILEG